YASQGLAAVVGVSPNPVTFFNPDSVLPQIGDGVRLGEIVRVVGDVRLGNGSRVGQRTAIRADAGTPIVIGQNARIGSRVTFHALLETSVSVGDNATIGDGCVLHGPLSVGNNLTCEDDCVLFRAVAEDNVILREGTIVPERAVIETQEQADALPTR
ncbi:MAG: carbonate dehydratase, partial [Chloroflexota bacterium]|nr:carbonate dehydratase [Chloroflexota bacterium]